MVYLGFEDWFDQQANDFPVFSFLCLCYYPLIYGSKDSPMLDTDLFLLSRPNSLNISKMDFFNCPTSH